MKVHAHGGDNSILTRPVEGFPFCHIQHEAVSDPDDADWIYLHLPIPTTDAVNAHAASIMTRDTYRAFADRYVTWALCDFPRYSLDFGGVKFLLSPMKGRKASDAANCHAMPVHPCLPDYEIAMDIAYTQECRRLEKRHDFCFLGQLDDFPYRVYGGRKWMYGVQERLGKDRFFIRSRHYNAIRTHDWGRQHREWMQRVGESRYGFCPVGGGDATLDPRLYWTMQVGTIPIITDAEFLAFDDVVSWDDLAVFIPSSEKVSFDYMSLPMDGPLYEKKREAVIAFWDDYCWYPNAANKLAEHYLQKG